MDNEKLKEYLEKEGYFDIKVINGVYCGLYRFIFTTGLVVGLDFYGYNHRYCYNTNAEAKEALSKYVDTNEHPPGNWLKRKGNGGDLPNEAYVKQRL